MIPEDIKKKIVDIVTPFCPGYPYDINYNLQLRKYLTIAEQSYSIRDEEVEQLNKIMDGIVQNREDSKAKLVSEITELKQKLSEKEAIIKRLCEFVEQFIPDPYPEDVFTPVSKERLGEIHELLKDEFDMPIDRLTGHIGRVLRNPLREDAKQLLSSIKQ